jgi:PBP1b-binding outer membrane lipoprotein LpoB
MKKVFAILTVAAFLTACNSGANSDAKKDSLNAIDSAKNAMKDSVTAGADTAKAMIDSTAKAKKDTVKAKM